MRIAPPTQGELFEYVINGIARYGFPLPPAASSKISADVNRVVASEQVTLGDNYGIGDADNTP